MGVDCHTNLIIIALALATPKPVVITNALGLMVIRGGCCGGGGFLSWM